MLHAPFQYTSTSEPSSRPEESGGQSTPAQNGGLAFFTPPKRSLPSRLTNFGKRTTAIAEPTLITDPIRAEAELRRAKRDAKSISGLVFSGLVLSIVALHLVFAYVLENVGERHPGALQGAAFAVNTPSDAPEAAAAPAMAETPVYAVAPAPQPPVREALSQPSPTPAPPQKQQANTLKDQELLDVLNRTSPAR